MSHSNNSMIILMADDDEDDRMLTADALQSSKLVNTLTTVNDGEELMDYLTSPGQVRAAGSRSTAGVGFAGSEYAQNGRQRSASRNEVRPGVADHPSGGPDHIESRRRY